MFHLESRHEISCKFSSFHYRTRLANEHPWYGARDPSTRTNSWRYATMRISFELEMKFPIPEGVDSVPPVASGVRSEAGSVWRVPSQLVARSRRSLTDCGRGLFSLCSTAQSNRIGPQKGRAFRGVRPSETSTAKMTGSGTAGGTARRLKSSR